ncbi:late cornified envelope protein 3A-like [Neofelis nebulosa]|uniref:late cornified envelope protein 3A-like n=1 Tax=Neofelis nebulosa TaxID=61452 RepID=UPI00272B1027|nr:late cornified envelope protein 3A-like [Neofelis nebulosa]
MFLLFVPDQPPAAMSCQQNQQQCQPPSKCPPLPKCPLKSPAQCLPSAFSSCAPGSGGSCDPSSWGWGGCCLSHRGCHGSHGCRHHSSDSCDGGSALQSGGSGCGHGSVGGC